MDLPFYDHLLAEMPDRKPEGFISTGKENRDVDTLLQSFSATNEELICTLPSHAATSTIKDTRPLFSARLHSYSLHRRSDSLRTGKTGSPQKLHRHLLSGLPLHRRTDHLVEAFALGIPVICSRNPNFEIDIDKEEIGITVEYNDVQGWIDAIRYIADHPEEARRMGENARKLAEERFNLEIFSREIAESLLEISNISSKTVHLHKLLPMRVPIINTSERIGGAVPLQQAG